MIWLVSNVSSKPHFTHIGWVNIADPEAITRTAPVSAAENNHTYIPGVIMIWLNLVVSSVLSNLHFTQIRQVNITDPGAIARTANVSSRK